MKITTTKFTQTPGIYVWENKYNKKVYVGQSVNVFRRVQGELKMLRNGNFHNEYMQRAWNKYGEDTFIVTQVMECEVYELDDAEALWGNFFDARNPEHGYNLREYGQDNHGHHEATIQKLREAWTDERKNEFGETVSKAQRARYGYDEIVDEIMHYYNVGLNYSEIKRLTGANSSVVQRIVRENEHLIEPSSLTRVEAFEAVKAGIIKPKTAAAVAGFVSEKHFNRCYKHWVCCTKPKCGGSNKSDVWTHVDEIVFGYENGISKAALGRKYGVSATTIANVLKAAGAI